MKKLLNALIFVLIIYISFIFIESKFFLVREININGDVSLIQKDIIDKIMLIKNKSIFSYNFSMLENEISNDIRVDYVDIKKKLPDKIEIEIKLREAIGIVEINDKFYFIDKNLNVFSYYEELKEKKLPIININDDEKEIEVLKLILNELTKSKIYSQISEIYKGEESYELILLDGVKIYTSEDVTTFKYDKAFEIYESEKKIYNLEYLELRYKDIAVK